MKHGAILPPIPQEAIANPPLVHHIVGKLREWRNFLWIVVLPTLMIAGYQYLFAADQYLTESEFIVKSGDSSRAAPSGLGQLFGLAGGIGQTEAEIMSVPDYLESHDAVNDLRKTADLISIFRRPEADLYSRLWNADPTPEALLKYYRSKVNVRYDRDKGIVHLTVRSFRPQDSYSIAGHLLSMGERRVNQMNRRSYQDAVRSAEQQLAIAERDVADIQRRMTGFREFNLDADPETSSQAHIKLVSELEGNLAAARSMLGSMTGVIRSDSPQYVALQRRIRSIEMEIANQTEKLTGDKSDNAQALGTYEDLRVRQEFAAKAYAAAASNLLRANEEVRKQQLYFVRVVNPNYPVKALFPERAKIVLTTLCGLLLAYGIGWLIIAGVREHEA